MGPFQCETHSTSGLSNMACWKRTPPFSSRISLLAMIDCQRVYIKVCVMVGTNTHTYTHIHLYTYTLIHIYTYTHIYICTYNYIFIYLYIYILYIYIYWSIYICIYVYIYVCIYIYIYWQTIIHMKQYTWPMADTCEFNNKTRNWSSMISITYMMQSYAVYKLNQFSHLNLYKVRTPSDVCCFIAPLNIVISSINHN